MSKYGKEIDLETVEDFIHRYGDYCFYRISNSTWAPNRLTF